MDILVVLDEAEMIIPEVVLKRVNGDGDSWTKDVSKSGEQIYFETSKLDLFF